MDEKGSVQKQSLPYLKKQKPPTLDCVGGFCLSNVLMRVRSLLFGLNLFLHVYSLAVPILEFILKESKSLTRRYLES